MTQNKLEIEPSLVQRGLAILLLAIALIILPSQITTKRIQVKPFTKPIIELSSLEAPAYALEQEQPKETVAEKPVEPIQLVEVPKVVETPPPAPKPVTKPAVKPKSYSADNIQQMIVDSANKYGVSPDRLLRIAKCESGFNPKAINRGYTAGGGNPTGLFQYLPETWNRYQRKLGVSGWDIYNPKHQADLTAFAFSIGGAGEWECR